MDLNILQIFTEVKFTNILFPNDEKFASLKKRHIKSFDDFTQDPSGNYQMISKSMYNCSIEKNRFVLNMEKGAAIPKFKRLHQAVFKDSVELFEILDSIRYGYVIIYMKEMDSLEKADEFIRTHFINNINFERFENPTGSMVRFTYSKDRIFTNIMISSSRVNRFSIDHKGKDEEEYTGVQITIDVYCQDRLLEEEILTIFDRLQDEQNNCIEIIKSTLEGIQNV